MRCLLIYSIVLWVGLLSCTSRGINKTDELKIVIVKYNNALIEAYKNQFFEPLTQVASEEVVRKIGVIVNSYRESDQIMEAELNKIEFREMVVEEDKATVRTSEDWSYRWINYRTVQEVEPHQDIHYEMFYHLLKKNGRWRVEKVEEEKQAKEK